VDADEIGQEHRTKDDHNDYGCTDQKPDNPDYSFDSIQPNIDFWRNGIRIHGAKNKPLHPVRQVFFIEKR